MLMHEWIKYRDRQVQRIRRKGEEAEPEGELPDGERVTPEAGSLVQRAQALQVAEEVAKRADQAQSRRLHALIARQQRLPLEVTAGRGSVTAEKGAGVKESREELIERLLDPTLTLSETAALLGVCPTTVRRYTKRGALKCFRTPGNQRRFRLSDVLDFIEHQHG